MSRSIVHLHTILHISKYRPSKTEAATLSFTDCSHVRSLSKSIVRQGLTKVSSITLMWHDVNAVDSGLQCCLGLDLVSNCHFVQRSAPPPPATLIGGTRAPSGIYLCCRGWHDFPVWVCVNTCWKAISLGYHTYTFGQMQQMLMCNSSGL